jgi:hypothetical protein
MTLRTLKASRHAKCLRGTSLRVCKARTFAARSHLFETRDVYAIVSGCCR